MCIPLRHIPIPSDDVHHHWVTLPFLVRHLNQENLSKHAQILIKRNFSSTATKYFLFQQNVLLLGSFSQTKINCLWERTGIFFLPWQIFLFWENFIHFLDLKTCLSNQENISQCILRHLQNNVKIRKLTLFSNNSDQRASDPKHPSSLQNRWYLYSKEILSDT